jgi:succinate dehydrogenase / fumarate reductase flavoprotein subunit
LPVRTNVSSVLVIGSGGAGLRAAIAAAGAGVEVTVIGKRTRKDAHTVLASGGINAVLGTRDPEDTWQQHFADTINEGYLLPDPRTVEIMATEAPARVLELAEWGCPFARTEDGRLDQRFFGAHRFRRTCYAGDYTGRAILTTLVAKATELNVPIVEHQYVSQLLVHDGTCFGALAFDIVTGEITAYLADAVVLATGGHTRLWRRSSSRRDENNGDGMYLALKAGCSLSGMELVQFHPTGMVTPEEMAGTLVTEAVRGEGGRLYNANGKRYMERYDPERMELSTRDRVALANYTEIAEGRGGPNGGVFLDITHVAKEEILEKLPRMYRQFIESQMIDISRHRMEVAPTAHYSMGGVSVRADTHSTDVDCLYAVGEVASGLHGANRLGGNSLAEILVFGKRAGEAAAGTAIDRDVSLRSRAVISEAVEDLGSFIHPGDEFARPLQRALRDSMWERCGVVRNAEGLEQGLKNVDEIRGLLSEVDVRPTSEGYGDLAHVLDLRASLAGAEATLLGAIERRETRGAHNRSDFPKLDPSLKADVVVRGDPAEGLKVSSRPIAQVSATLKPFVEQERVTGIDGRLLE